MAKQRQKRAALQQTITINSKIELRNEKNPGRLIPGFLLAGSFSGISFLQTSERKIFGSDSKKKSLHS